MFRSNSSYLPIARLRALTLTMLVMLVTACSGSGSGGQSNAGLLETAGCVPGDATTAGQCSNVLVAVTDAEGAFVSYAVDILSLTLQRGDGGSVETLPATTRVDFAALTELSEIVSSATLVPGDIVGGSIQIDYSNAEVFVEANGDIVPAELVGVDGMPLGVVDVEIRLADRDRLVLTRGRTALLSVDFDLAVSHEVDTAESPPRVTTLPYIVAEVEPIDSKEIRLRGTLVDVDLENSYYEIRVRPWHRRVGDHGSVTVHTTETTSFEIGDAMYTGEDGLRALAELGAGSLSVAFGTLSTSERRFTAEIVHARESAGDGVDAIYGNIVSRDGDRLLVKGALAAHRDAPARFRRTVSVTVGPDTSVYKIADRDGLLGTDALSVGQRIVAFGELQQLDAADAAWQLDATQGRVRMLVTRLHGTINSMVDGQINLYLRGIDRLGIDMFDFAGTGMDPAHDANPTDYEVSTGMLALTDLVVDKWTRVHGFVTPFGMAPPDFEGRTVVDHRNIPAVLGIGWGIEGTLAPFSQMGPESLVPNLDNRDIGARHHMLLGRRLVDLFDLPMAPAIVPSDARSLYGIWEPGHVELFAVFADFVEELELRLSSTDAARSLSASGQYDESTGRVTARRIAVHMLPAE